MHDVVIVGIPLLAILAGILFGRQDTSALRGEMNTLRADMNRRFDSMDARFDTIHRDFREFTRSRRGTISESPRWSSRSSA